MKSPLLALAATALLAPGCVIGVEVGESLEARLILTWSIEQASTRAPLDCALAGADTVRVTSRNTDTGDLAIDLFDCSAESGTTADLVSGNYLINVDLVSCGGGATCNNAPIVSRAATMGPYGIWDDGDYDLGHFVFLVH